MSASCSLTIMPKSVTISDSQIFGRSRLSMRFAGTLYPAVSLDILSMTYIGDLLAVSPIAYAI